MHDNDKQGSFNKNCEIHGPFGQGSWIKVGLILYMSHGPNVLILYSKPSSWLSAWFKQGNFYLNCEIHRLGKPSTVPFSKPYTSSMSNLHCSYVVECS